MKTEQEKFWQSNFGDEYTKKNNWKNFIQQNKNVGRYLTKNSRCKKCF